MHTSVDLDADPIVTHNSPDISKEKFSLDMSAIDSPGKQTNNNKSRNDQDNAIKEMSHFGNSMQSASIYSQLP